MFMYTTLSDEKTFILVCYSE